MLRNTWQAAHAYCSFLHPTQCAHTPHTRTNSLPLPGLAHWTDISLSAGVQCTNYRIYSRISRQCMMAICQWRSLCVPHTAWTISRSLGLRVCVVGRVLNDHAQTYAAAAAAAVTWHHSNTSTVDRARPSFSDHEIKDDDDSTHQICPILTHITDYKGGDVYDNCAELLN